MEFFGLNGAALMGLAFAPAFMMLLQLVMRIHQIIFLGVITAAFIVGCIKSPRKVIGGVIGGFLGFLGPFLLAQVYVWRGGDPTAAGVFSFFCLFTIPVGLAIGVAVARQTRKSKAPHDDHAGKR